MINIKQFQSAGAVSVAVLGLAVASSVVEAGSVTARTDMYSKQFTQRTAAVTAASTSALGSVTIVTAAASQSGDTMTITLGGTAGAQFAVTTPGAGFGTLACAGTTAWTQVSGTATTRVFRSATVAGDVAGNCTFDTATLTNASLGASAAGGTITVSAVLNRDVTALDNMPASLVGSVIDQFVATVAKAWDGVIDYTTADGRLFTDAAADAAVGARAAGALTAAGGAVAAITTNDAERTDTLVLQLLDRSARVANAAALDTTTGFQAVINGDFSVLSNTTADGCLLPGTDGGNFITVTRQDGAVGEAVAGTAIGTVTSTDCNSITVTLTGAQVGTIVGEANSLMAIKFNVSNAVNAAGDFTRKDIKWQSFTGSATFFYTVLASAVVQSDAETTFAPGAHTAQGSDIFVSYMPTGTNIFQNLWIANKSERTGTVTMTARNQNGVACTSANMGGRVTINANRVTDLGAMLAAGLSNCFGGANATNKLFITVRADLPDTAVELFSSYNVNGNRVSVTNTSNGRLTGAGNVGGGNASL